MPSFEASPSISPEQLLALRAVVYKMRLERRKRALTLAIGRRTTN